MTTTSFDDWLETNLESTDYDDVWNLYHSVIEECLIGTFKTVKNESQGKYFVTNECGEGTLMLASDRARDAFLRKIEDDYCEDMDIEGYYAFHKAMEKDD